MNRSPEVFQISCHIRHETDDAILLYDDASEQAVWIPLSQVDEIHRQKDNVAVVVMRRWIAAEKGLL